MPMPSRTSTASYKSLGEDDHLKFLCCTLSYFHVHSWLILYSLYLYLPVILHHSVVLACAYITYQTKKQKVCCFLLRFHYLSILKIAVMRTPSTFLALGAALLEVTAAASTFSPARPPAIPLAVKSPYLNLLQFAGGDGGNGGYLAGQYPQFWALVESSSSTNYANTVGEDKLPRGLA